PLHRARSRGRGARERRQRAYLVEEARGRDLAVDHVLHEEAHVVLELARERSVDAKLGRTREIALQEIAQRFESAHGEPEAAAELRGTRGAERAAGCGAPRVLSFLQRLAARDALVQLGPEARAIEQVKVEPAAHEARRVPCVEVSQGRFEQIEE